MFYQERGLYCAKDSLLVELLSRGNAEAFEIIYNRYAPLLLVHAERMLANASMAQDVVHDLFTSLWQKREKINIEVNLKSYLYKATRNRVLDLFAQEKVRVDYKKQLNHSEQVDDSLLQNYQSKELKSLIESELCKLPEQMRKAFLLSRLEEKSYKEIAAELHIAEGTVKKQIYLALKRLKKNIVYFFLF